MWILGPSLVVHWIFRAGASSLGASALYTIHLSIGAQGMVVGAALQGLGSVGAHGVQLSSLKAAPGF